MNKKERFLSKHSLDGGFLQSDFWASFQDALNKKYFWVGGGEQKVLVIENELPIVGKYLYIPRGPVWGENKKENQEILKKIKDLAKEQKAGWIRFEPQKKEDLKLISGKMFKARKNHQPAETLMIDLTQKQDEILAQMKQKTRYNIRLAEKKGVKVKVSENEKDLEVFWQLVQETAQRDGVSFHGKDYYQKMLEVIPQSNLELLLAYKEEKIIGAVLLSFYGEVATYLHGASSNEDRNLMANYLLQWEAIKRAKEKGCEKYDFFGIAVNENKEKWAGITKFKKGFAPEIEPVIFPGCWDLVLCPMKYFVYRILQIIK